MTDEQIDDALREIRNQLRLTMNLLGTTLSPSSGITLVAHTAKAMSQVEALLQRNEK